MVESKERLSREFVDRSIARLFNEFESLKKWGKVEVTIQAGGFRAIKKEETITTESSK